MKKINSSFWYIMPSGISAWDRGRLGSPCQSHQETVKSVEGFVNNHAIIHIVNILFIWPVPWLLAAVYQHIASSWKLFWWICPSYNTDPEYNKSICLYIILSYTKHTGFPNESVIAEALLRKSPLWPLEAIWDHKSLEPQFRIALGKVGMANFPHPQYQMLR